MVNAGIQEGMRKLLLGAFAENKLKQYLLQESSEKDGRSGGLFCIVRLTYLQKLLEMNLS